MAYPSKIRGKITKEELEFLYHEKRMSFKEIGKMFNCSWSSVQSYASELGIKKKPIAIVREQHQSNKKVNKDFFSSWSKEVAYVLGIILTDGSIESNGELRLLMTDFDVVESVAKAMQLENGTAIVKTRTKPQMKLSICRQKLYVDMVKLGVCMDYKTLNQVFPNVPREFRSHFLRGLFDGDGCIVTRKRKVKSGICHTREVTVITTSSLSMAEGVTKLLSEELGIDREVYHQIKADEKRADVYRVNIYNREDIDKFFNYIYQDKGYLYMRRKYEKFQG